MSHFARFVLFVLLASSVASAQVTVLHPEGSLHGFLVLRSTTGEILATGDLVQTVKGKRLTARTALHFKDGSLHEETAVYTQQRVLRLISDHLAEKGPSFPHPVDMRIDAIAGNVTVRSTAGDKEEDKTEHIALPPDLANGILVTTLKNLSTHTQAKLSLVIASPKPHVVKLNLSFQGEDSFSVGGIERKARHFVAKFEFEGLAAAVAPLIGKEPPELNFWIYNDSVPAFLRSQGPLYSDGPVWTIELASPVWLDSKGTYKEVKP